MRIQHNILAMNSYRNYSNNTAALGKNLEKLSSGYKINRAGDDAAGLAISEKMRAQITGLNAAQKNVKDGISLVKTAEGAMQEIQDMLNRMDYLATQSANGTYQDDVDREALQKEVNQLKDEINRIADSSNFNGIKLLDGSLEPSSKTEVTYSGATNLEIVATATTPTQGSKTILHKDGGAGSKTSFELEMSNFNAAVKAGVSTPVTIGVTIGDKDLTITVPEDGLDSESAAKAIYDALVALDTDGTGIALGGTDTPKYNVTLAGDTLKFEMTDEAFKGAEKASEFAYVPTVGVSFEADEVATGQSHTDWKMSNVHAGSPAAGDVLADTVTASKYDLTSFTDGSGIKIGDTTYVWAMTDKTAETDFGEGVKVVDLRDLVGDDGALDKSKAPGTGSSKTEVVNVALSRLSEAAADNKMFSVQVTNDQKLAFREKKDYEGDADLSTMKGLQSQLQTYTKVSATTTTSKGKALQLQIGDTSDDFNQLKVKVGDMHTSALGIADLSIGTAEDAAAAIQTIKDAINNVSSVRGDLGAYQNRLEHTQNNLSVMAENIQDAESTIRDTDVAEEMMSYVKNNILVQSAQAMLAQANQVPQGVLQLLG